MGLFDAGARKGQPVTVHDRVLTAANAITALRLLGLPFFVALMLDEEYLAAFITLAVVGATDWLDGYVARRFDQVTKLGRLMDPLIDRLLLATAAVTFLVLDIIPWQIVVAIVARDVVLLLASLIVFGGNPDIPVSKMGKFATACLLIGVPSFLLAYIDWAGDDVFLVIAWGHCIVGVVAYYLAGIGYVRAGLAILRARRMAAQEAV